MLFRSSTELKTLLAVLLLGVGIAIAYDSFFAVHEAKQIIENGTKNLGPFSNFIRDLSKDVPIHYGIISIIFAIVIGVAGAFIRKFFSNLKKNILSKVK